MRSPKKKFVSCPAGGRNCGQSDGFKIFIFFLTIFFFLMKKRKKKFPVTESAVDLISIVMSLCYTSTSEVTDKK